VTHLQDASHELNTAMATIGYPETAITVGTWDGDRLKATATLMRRSRSLDINA
jgi:hypothetical protein